MTVTTPDALTEMPKTVEELEEAVSLKLEVMGGVDGAGAGEVKS